MYQYLHCFKAGEVPGIDRGLNAAEYSEARTFTRRYGLKRLDRRAAAGAL